MLDAINEEMPVAAVLDIFSDFAEQQAQNDFHAAGEILIQMILEYVASDLCTAERLSEMSDENETLLFIAVELLNQWGDDEQLCRYTDELFDLILKKMGANLNDAMIRQQFFDVLLGCIEKKNQLGLQRLLASDVCPSDILQMQDGDGDTLLMSAVMLASADLCIDMIRSRPWDPDILVQKNYRNKNLLSLMMVDNDLPSLSALLDIALANVDIDNRKTIVFDTIDLALSYFDEDIVSAILNRDDCPHGILTIQDPEGNNLLMRALQHGFETGFEAGVEIILGDPKCQPAVLSQKNHQGENALMLCAQLGDVKSSLLLLQSPHCDFQALYDYNLPATFGADKFQPVPMLVQLAVEARAKAKFELTQLPASELQARYQQARQSLVQRFYDRREKFVRLDILHTNKVKRLKGRYRGKGSYFRHQADDELQQIMRELEHAEQIDYGVKDKIPAQALDAIVDLHMQAQLNKVSQKLFIHSMGAARAPSAVQEQQQSTGVQEQQHSTGHRRTFSL